jgi:hypothetical protein
VVAVLAVSAAGFMVAVSAAAFAAGTLAAFAVGMADTDTDVMDTDDMESELD